MAPSRWSLCTRLTLLTIVLLACSWAQPTDAASRPSSLQHHRRSRLSAEEEWLRAAAESDALEAENEGAADGNARDDASSFDDALLEEFAAARPTAAAGRTERTRSSIPLSLSGSKHELSRSFLAAASSSRATNAVGRSRPQPPAPAAKPAAKAKQQKKASAKPAGSADWATKPEWWTPGAENEKPWVEDPYAYLLRPRDPNTIPSPYPSSWPRRNHFWPRPVVNVPASVYAYQSPPAPLLPELDASMQPQNNLPGGGMYDHDTSKEYIWG